MPPGRRPSTASFGRSHASTVPTALGRSPRPPLLDGRLDPSLEVTRPPLITQGRAPIWARATGLMAHRSRTGPALRGPPLCDGSSTTPGGCPRTRTRGSPTRSVTPLRSSVPATGHHWARSWSLTQLRVHRVQRRASITRLRTSRRVLLGTRTAEGYRRTISVHVRPCNLRDHPGSLRPWLPTSSPTSRFIVASSSSGTQPTVLVCWATPDRLPCRRRHCRPRGRSSSMMLAISRARRRPEPRAERARLLRASLPPQ